jgi:hypothetical protein
MAAHNMTVELKATPGTKPWAQPSESWASIVWQYREHNS